MLASQFNLDHRLAELRQVGTELCHERAARAANRSGRSVAATIRWLFGSAAAARRISAAAH